MINDERPSTANAGQGFERAHQDESVPPEETPLPSLDGVKELAKDANSALNGLADAVGLTEHVEKAPYAMLGAALGIGYVIGGGLFTPTTARLIRMGMKLTAIPQVRDRLLDVAEAAIDGVLANATNATGKQEPEQ